MAAVGAEGASEPVAQTGPEGAEAKPVVEVVPFEAVAAIVETKAVPGQAKDTPGPLA